MNKCKFKSEVENFKNTVLVSSLWILSFLALAGILSVTTTFADINISRNPKTSIKSNYIAKVGIEHARQVLKSLNEVGTDPDSFSDELTGVTGTNGTLEGDTGTDEVPIITATNLGNGSYAVYLTNDPVDGSTNQTDSNNKVCLTSFATTLDGSQCVVKMTVATTN